MNNISDFILQYLGQFFGGPGPIENNLVRFSIPMILWGALFIIALSRQREHDLPREKLLVWGFGMGASSAFVMLVFIALQMLGVVEREAAYVVLVPLERALLMASIVVVAGAFLRYILDDARLASTYIQVGLGITVVCLVIALWQWPQYYADLSDEQFHTAWVASIFQVFTSILIIIAIVLLRRKKGWLTNVVTVALLFFLTCEVLFLVNNATDKMYNRFLCPIGNAFPILAIPLLGYVYLREQSIEKRQVEKDLEVYRHHLEDLVEERTEALTGVNTQLKHEVDERIQAEKELEQLSHQYELILDSAGEGICGIDREGRFSFVNAAAAKLLGYQPDELVGKPSHPICHHTRADHTPYPEEMCPIYDGYARGIPGRGDDQLFWRKDNTNFPVVYISNPTYENGELTGAVVVFRDITERKRAEAEIAQRNADLAAQNAIAATLSRSLDLETILDSSLESVLSLVDMDVGLIFLWDAALQELVLRGCEGQVFQDRDINTKQECHCCLGISNRAMKELKAVIEPISDDPEEFSSSILAREGVKIMVSVPLVSKGRAVGALTMGSRQTISNHPGKLELLTAFGQQIGMAVDNAHLYRKAERAARELALLHQISIELTSTFSANKIYDQIVKQAVKLLDCQISCILEWDDAEGSPRLIASYGLGGIEGCFLELHAGRDNYLQELICCEEPIVIGDTHISRMIPPSWGDKYGIRAILCVPMWGMKEKMGTLFLVDQHSARKWRPEEIVLVESFVNRAAVALMNARLHEQLEWAAALEERQRIAADMHDGLAQMVSLVGLQIEEAMDLVKEGSGEKAVNELTLTREVVDQLSFDVRRSIASLHRAPKVQRPLQELLPGLLEQILLEAEYPIEYVCEVEDPILLPPDQADEVIMIVQEALLNAQNHANAKNIKLFLENPAQRILIRIEDDGEGFELGEWWENSHNHFGLSIMHARAARIGANLRIDSSPGLGTRVLLAIDQVTPDPRKRSGNHFPEAGLQLSGEQRTAE